MSCKTLDEATEVTLASAQMPASWQAGLVTTSQAGCVPGVSGVPTWGHSPAQDKSPPTVPQKAWFCPSAALAVPWLCCSPASPMPCPPIQAMSAQFTSSTCRCPLPFSEAQRDVPAWPQLSNERSHRTAPWQGCSPLTMLLSAWNGMQEAEVLLGRVSDTAVAAWWGPQEQGAHLTLGMITLHMLSWAPCDPPHL